MSAGESSAPLVRTKQAEVETSLTEARAEVKLKAYQFEQLSIAMEHAKSAQRQAALENEMLQQKVTLLRSELEKEKTAASRRIAILEVQLGACLLACRHVFARTGVSSAHGSNSAKRVTGLLLCSCVSAYQVLRVNECSRFRTCIWSPIRWPLFSKVTTRMPTTEPLNPPSTPSHLQLCVWRPLNRATRAR